ncbi:hypothetical protein SynBIOSE41_02398 [Synechococcus sp. BIOS-E4-1]|uniref:hypothetical protein n=1 Tax=Synechococcus sp. BIOS-E4-1 TaxID=1400864 RepID=UPI00164429E1|nr:hypothetical protein [Synechococcus sp. BIOS-E4-1]QNI54897.1 hypothetical protein SynBIOSE41_02398 [Synechococcus sp. BIOS-E4-1]
MVRDDEDAGESAETVNSSLHAWSSATKLLEFSIERTGERGMFHMVRLQCPVTNLTELPPGGM